MKQELPKERRNGALAELGGVFCLAALPGHMQKKVIFELSILHVQM